MAAIITQQSQHYPPIAHHNHTHTHTHSTHPSPSFPTPSSLPDAVPYHQIAKPSSLPSHYPSPSPSFGHHRVGIKSVATLSISSSIRNNYQRYHIMAASSSSSSHAATAHLMTQSQPLALPLPPSIPNNGVVDGPVPQSLSTPIIDSAHHHQMVMSHRNRSPHSPITSSSTLPTTNTYGYGYGHGYAYGYDTPRSLFGGDRRRLPIIEQRLAAFERARATSSYHRSGVVSAPSTLMTSPTAPSASSSSAIWSTSSPLPLPSSPSGSSLDGVSSPSHTHDSSDSVDDDAIHMLNTLVANPFDTTNEHTVPHSPTTTDVHHHQHTSLHNSASSMMMMQSIPPLTSSGGIAMQSSLTSSNPGMSMSHIDSNGSSNGSSDHHQPLVNPWDHINSLTGSGGGAGESWRNLPSNDADAFTEHDSLLMDPLWPYGVTQPGSSSSLTLSGGNGSDTAIVSMITLPDVDAPPVPLPVGAITADADSIATNTHAYHYNMFSSSLPSLPSPSPSSVEYDGMTLPDAPVPLSLSQSLNGTLMPPSAPDSLTSVNSHSSSLTSTGSSSSSSSLSSSRQLASPHASLSSVNAPLPPSIVSSTMSMSLGAVGPSSPSTDSQRSMRTDRSMSPPPSSSSSSSSSLQQSSSNNSSNNNGSGPIRSVSARAGLSTRATATMTNALSSMSSSTSSAAAASANNSNTSTHGHGPGHGMGMDAGDRPCRGREWLNPSCYGTCPRTGACTSCDQGFRLRRDTIRAAHLNDALAMKQSGVPITRQCALPKMYVLIAFDNAEQACTITAQQGSGKLMAYTQSPYRHDDDPHGDYEYFVYCRACRHIQIAHNRANVRKATNGCCAWNKLQIPVRKAFIKSVGLPPRPMTTTTATSTSSAISSPAAPPPPSPTPSSASSSISSPTPLVSSSSIPPVSVPSSASSSSSFSSSSSSSSAVPMTTTTNVSPFSAATSPLPYWSMEPTLVYSSSTIGSHGIQLTMITRAGAPLVPRLASRASLVVSVAGEPIQCYSNDHAVAVMLPLSFFSPPNLQHLWSQMYRHATTTGDTRPRLIVQPRQIQCIVQMWDTQDTTFPPYEGIFTYIDDGGMELKSPSTPSTPSSTNGGNGGNSNSGHHGHGHGAPDSSPDRYTGGGSGGGGESSSSSSFGGTGSMKGHSLMTNVSPSPSPYACPWGTGFYFSPGGDYGVPSRGFNHLLLRCNDWLPSLKLPFITMIIDALVDSYGAQDARIARHRQTILEHAVEHSEHAFTDTLAHILYQIYLYITVHHTHTHGDGEREASTNEYIPSVLIILDCLLMLQHHTYFMRIVQEEMMIPPTLVSHHSHDTSGDHHSDDSNDCHTDTSTSSSSSGNGTGDHGGFIMAFPRRASITLIAYEPPHGFTTIKAQQDASHALEIASMVIPTSTLLTDTITPTPTLTTSVFGHGWPLIRTAELHQLLGTPMALAASDTTPATTVVIPPVLRDMNDIVTPLGVSSSSRTAIATPQLLSLLAANVRDIPVRVSSATAIPISSSSSTSTTSTTSTTMVAGVTLESKQAHETKQPARDNSDGMNKEEDDRIIDINTCDITKPPVGVLPAFDIDQWSIYSTTKLDQSIVDQIITLLEPLPLANPPTAPAPVPAKSRGVRPLALRDMKFLKVNEIVMPSSSSSNDGSSYMEATFYSDPGNDIVTLTFWQRCAVYVAYLWQSAGLHATSMMTCDMFVTHIIRFICTPSYKALNMVYTRSLTRTHLRHLFQLHAYHSASSSSVVPLSGDVLDLRRFALAFMCLLVPIPMSEPSLSYTIDTIYHQLLSDDMLLSSYHGALSRVQATNRLHASQYGPGACILRLAEPRVEQRHNGDGDGDDEAQPSSATKLPIAYGLALVCSHTRYDQHDAHQLVSMNSSSSQHHHHQQQQSRLVDQKHTNWIDQWRSDFLSIANSKTPHRRYHRVSSSSSSSTRPSSAS